MTMFDRPLSESTTTPSQSKSTSIPSPGSLGDGATDGDGAAVGEADGDADGEADGEADGPAVGDADGDGDTVAGTDGVGVGVGDSDSHTASLSNVSPTLGCDPASGLPALTVM